MNVPYASYAIAIGSNRATSARMGPEALVTAAFAALDRPPLRLHAASPVMHSAPLGPSRRHFANAAALVETSLSPPALLIHLKALEQAFGRRRGQRWGARTLDLDIIFWAGGRWRDRTLGIPHPAFHRRIFVLAPLARVAPRWRDPLSGRTVRQLLAQAIRPKPVDRMNMRH